jgi:hypothetical protein
VLRFARKNFTTGDSPEGGWYAHVQGVSVSGTQTTVETDLADDRSGSRQADQICANLRGALPGITDVVRVTGAAGRTLARCVP